MIVIVVIFAYLGLVLIVGTVSHRFFRGTGEDYFVASRTIGPFVLLMSLFRHEHDRLLHPWCFW